MSERFYINSPLAPGIVVLDGPEAHHLATVCRLRVDDEVCLFNGDGREYPARVTAVARREVTLHVLEIQQPERELPFRLEVAAPLPRGDRGQFLIEKLTELGVTTYVPLSSLRSVHHPGQGKRTKLERYVVEASKQCGRNCLMELSEWTSWETYAASTDDGGLRILGHPYQAHDLSSLATVSTAQAQSGSVRIAVGPEGGLVDTEIALARQQGWHVIALGPRILRVETAAIFLVAAAIAAKYAHFRSVE